MKKLLFALIVLALSACTKELSITVEPQQVQTIHVMVGAGIGDAEPQTRSTVSYSGGIRTLQFTTGDRLYVRGVLEREPDNTGIDQETKIVAGYLTVDASSISPSGTSASFTGDLDVLEGEIVGIEFGTKYVVDQEGYWGAEEVCVGDDPDTGGPMYEWREVWYDEEGHDETDYDNPTKYGIVSYSAGSFNFSDPSNPLAECISTSAVLVHKDAGTHFAVDAQRNGSYQGVMAANAEELMTTSLVVEGTYNGSQFTLSASGTNPILNCTISGLAAGASYDVTYLFGADSYKDSKQSLSSVTADAQGKTTFAFFGKTIENGYHALRFINQADKSEWKLADIARKTLGNKVYNVSRTVIDDPDALQTPGIIWISVQDGQSTTPDQYNCYHIWGPRINGHHEPSEISIYGIFEDCYFSMEFGSTIHLSNVTGSYGNCDFIFSSGNVNLDISGTNHITSRYRMQAIGVGGRLTLSGNGTLTLTANNVDRGGLWCNSGYGAADGYTVSRSDRTDNGDGTYTWTYTVAPAN